MKKNGFTLVELLAVIVVMALVLVISIPLVSNAGKTTKIKTLHSKVENIKKAAILYAQDKNNNVKFASSSCSDTSHYSTNPCSGITGSCECAILPITKTDSLGNVTLIGNPKLKVSDLITGGTLKADDDSGNIINPVDKTKAMNHCVISIYKKYGKIYAIYDKEEVNDGECWYVE